MPLDRVSLESSPTSSLTMRMAWVGHPYSAPHSFLWQGLSRKPTTDMFWGVETAFSVLVDRANGQQAFASLSLSPESPCSRREFVQITEMAG
jgi:hypothetical protein